MRYIPRISIVFMMGGVLGCGSQPLGEGDNVNNAATRYVDELRQDTKRAETAVEKMNKAMEKSQQSVEELEKQSH